MNLTARLPAIFSFFVLALAVFAVGYTCGYKRGYADANAGHKSQLAQSKGETNVRH